MKIDPDEIAKNAIELAGVIERRDVIMEKKRESNARFRNELKFFDERLKELAAAVNKGEEQADVEVIEKLVVGTNEIQVTRTDTGEVLSTRTATAEDRQEALELGPPAKAKKGKRPAATVGELIVEAKAHGKKLEKLAAPVDLGDIDDPDAMLANDAQLDAPTPIGRRSRKEKPRTQEDHVIAAIDKKNATQEETES